MFPLWIFLHPALPSPALSTTTGITRRSLLCCYGGLRAGAFEMETSDALFPPDFLEVDFFVESRGLVLVSW